MNESLLKATDPNQYDSTDLNWEVRGAEDRPSRKHFREGLYAIVPAGTLAGKKVIDIGSGVGQLFNSLKKEGATQVWGIDPSERNIKSSAKNYPWANSIRATLRGFAQSTNERFDVAVCILAFEHIENLDEAFSDISKILENNGQFYLIIGDKDYHSTNNKELRPGLINVEIVNDLGEGAVQTKTAKHEKDGPSVLFDIFRPVEQVRSAAERNGFSVVVEKDLYGIPGTPSEKVIICHTFLFVRHN